MNIKSAVRLSIDLAMTISLLFAFAYHITGDVAHEWTGVAVFILFIAHNVINRQWYKNIFRGKYGYKRIVMTAVNIPLAFLMTAVIVTGFLQSRAVLAFLDLPGGMLLRQIHTAAAWWGLVFISLHIGIHWQMIINGARQMAGMSGKNSVRTGIARVLAFLTAASGVWASCDREMFGKLFQGFSFDYWDGSRPAVLYFAVMLSIMSVYICAVHYALKLPGRKRRETKSD
jgi:hypothetical protein